jgi:hypothetical protein
MRFKHSIEFNSLAIIQGGRDNETNKIENENEIYLRRDFGVGEESCDW